LTFLGKEKAKKLGFQTNFPPWSATTVASRFITQFSVSRYVLLFLQCHKYRYKPKNSAQ